MGTIFKDAKAAGGDLGVLGVFPAWQTGPRDVDCRAGSGGAVIPAKYSWAHLSRTKIQERGWTRVWGY